MSERLVQAIKDIGVTQTEIAKKINRTPQYISRMTSGKSQITLQALECLSNAYNISADWIITGKKPDIAKNTVAENQSEYSKADDTLTTFEPDQTFGIPEDLPSVRIPIVTECGANTDLDSTAFYPCELPYEYITFENCRSVRVTGKSMEPIVLDGQRIIFSKTDQVNNGDTAFITLKGGTQLFKKYHKDEKSCMVILNSVNQSGFEPFLIKEDQIEFIYKVVGVLY